MMNITTKDEFIGSLIAVIILVAVIYWLKPYVTGLTTGELVKYTLIVIAVSLAGSALLDKLGWGRKGRR